MQRQMMSVPANVSTGPPGIQPTSHPPNFNQPGNFGPPGTLPPPNIGMQNMGPPPPGIVPPPGMVQPPNFNQGNQPQNMSQLQNVGPPQNLSPPQNIGPPPNNNQPGSIGPPHLEPPGQGQSPTSLQPPPGLNVPNWMDESQEKQPPALPSLMSVKVDKPDDLKNKGNSELILPKALEDVFAFKDQLAGELGRKDGEIPIDSEKISQKTSTGVISTDYADADVDSDDDEPNPSASSTVSKIQHKLDKNKKKKQRKKQNRKQRQAKTDEAEANQTNGEDRTDGEGHRDTFSENEDDVTIEYVPDKITVADLAPMYRQFYRVFELFKLEDKPSQKEIDAADDKNAQLKKDKEKLIEDEDEDMEEEKKDDKEKLSKRKLKKLTRLSVAELKQLVNRPDVVEMHDVTARDPKLLVQLKAHRNTVQVPRHWCFKRKYLQGKRGIEKPPFDLPAFIKKTGIMEMRASLQEKDEAKTLKAKMRERARPKMGKIDIDYQKLHDAFFK